ncbi:MAG: tryptophan synthase subunit alpha [Proteobacteria bacterium]|nr:tryptophan synthase subunit alpha [Pseudomonadota bacterium]
MSRITSCLKNLKDSGRTALVPFVTAGDPVIDITPAIMHGLVDGGADIVELGIPFSDPEADGPVIQAASERALANHVRLLDVLEVVRVFRLTNATTPIILMGYLNSILGMGEGLFAQRAGDAGVDGVIMVNMPPEESLSLRKVLDPVGIDIIFLVAPTTSDERARKIAAAASGFVYYVSLKGITGAGHIDVESVRTNLERLRKLINLPLLVGFGIKNGTTARAVGQHADGVVMGAALVQTVAAHADAPHTIPAALTHQLKEVREALDRP